jgi:hypothetical protein
MFTSLCSIGENDDQESIAVLNARATLKSKKDGLVPEDVENAWNIYVSLLKDNNGQRPKDDPMSTLGQAYYQFLMAHGKCNN